MSLDGKVAVVTGGGTGLGREMALAMGRGGANLVLAARRPQPLEETAAELRKMGRKAIAVPTDVTDSKQVNAMVERCISEFGRIDILVNNAGGGSWEFFGISPLDLTDEQWHRGLDLDLSGAFYCCRAAGRYMIKERKGKVINISSLLGITGTTTRYLQVTYSIGKASVIQLTKTLATLWAEYGINVNCIAASLIATPSGVPDMSPESIAAAGRYVPVGRVGQPHEIGPLAVFLASPASDYMTGEIFIFDGGTLAGRFAPAGHQPIIPIQAQERGCGPPGV